MLSIPEMPEAPELSELSEFSEAPAIEAQAPDLEVLAMGHKIVDLLEDRQAIDIVMLDLRTVSLVADLFIIASADNRRQMRALIDTLLEGEHKKQFPPARIDGTPESGWIVLDYGAVVVHVFDPDTRAFYKLEQLWKKAPVVLRIQ